MRVEVAHRSIGEGQGVLIVAEIGVNHDGSVRRAIQLVDEAADAGADAVKLQLFSAHELMHPSGRLAAYQKRTCADSDPEKMLRRFELSEAAVRRIVTAIRDRGLIPLATPFSTSDVESIKRLDLPAVKIASPDLVNYPLLREAASLGKPLLVSTGAATHDEIARTVDWLRRWRASFALLHCVSSYPASADDANLCWIGELAERFGVPVGYSDHTTELSAGALAVAAGATIVEKHLTWNRKADGPDHAASSDPAQFARYARLIRMAERLRGQNGKHVLPVEMDVRDISRQSLVLKRALRAGEMIREEDLTAQRPGSGISAGLLLEVVGRRANRDLLAGIMLYGDMLAERTMGAHAA